AACVLGEIVEGTFAGGTCGTCYKMLSQRTPESCLSFFGSCLLSEISNDPESSDSLRSSGLRSHQSLQILKSLLHESLDSLYLRQSRSLSQAPHARSIVRPVAVQPLSHRPPANMESVVNQSVGGNYVPRQALYISTA